jgi:hypothetical protein
MILSALLAVELSNPPRTTELLQGLAEWRWAEVQVPLDRQAQWPPSRLQL